MISKAAIPRSLLAENNATAMLELFFEFNHLKQLFRQGWLERGIGPERCETVAEHSFSTALLAMLLADTCAPHLDSGKVLRIALLHDIGEVYAGDITPGHGIDRAEKRRMEQEAVQRLFGKLPGGERYMELWREYEYRSSPEALFVRQVDKLEMALQAGVYELQELADLDEFFRAAARRLQEPAVRALFEELQGLRLR